MTLTLQNLTKNNITGLILAGGKGSRMQMRNKGLLKLEGKTLVEQRITALSPQVADIIISANKDIKNYLCFGYPVVRDESEEYLGPLAGLAAGWHNCKTDWMISCPCDTPYLADDYVSRMIGACVKAEKIIAVARDHNSTQNTFILMHRSASASIKQALTIKQLAVHKWLAGQDTTTVDFSDCPDMFINFNTTEEFDAYVNNT